MLDARITQALSEPIASADAAKVLDAALAEYRTLERRADALDSEALSPALPLRDAQAKRQQAADARFVSDRLDAAVSALWARVEELREQEQAAATKARQGAAIIARDELAAEIAERYPAIVRELTSLAKRISETDDLCRAAGVAATAESDGRGLPANFIAHDGTVARIGQTSLPMPASAWPAWGPGGGSIGDATAWRGLDA